MVHNYGCSICKRPSKENIVPANISQTNELIAFRKSAESIGQRRKNTIKW
jgi:hypothetical protein